VVVVVVVVVVFIDEILCTEKTTRKKNAVCRNNNLQYTMHSLIYKYTPEINPLDYFSLNFFYKKIADTLFA